MEEKLVNPLLTDTEGPLFFLKILTLCLSLIRCKFNYGFDVFRMQTIENFEKKVAFWQTLLFLSRWIWKVISHLRQCQCLLVVSLDCQLWPIWDGSSRYICLKKCLLLAAQNCLDMSQAGLLERWHQVSNYRNE